MKKAVFFDIDGTLWDQEMQIPQSTIDAIKALRKNGHYAFLCSGRSRANIRNEKLLGIGFDGVIASCGTHIDFHKETIFEVLLTEKQVAHLLSLAERYHMPVVLEGPKHIYVNPEDFLDDPYVIHLRKELGEDLRVIPKDPAMITINKLSAETTGINLEGFIRELDPEFEVIVHTGVAVLEVILAEYTKATGIKKVCEIFHLEQEDTYAFGDSENDIEMLQFVAHGIAMGNASDKLKETAEYITSSINENGIANGLKHYGLI